MNPEINVSAQTQESIQTVLSVLEKIREVYEAGKKRADELMFCYGNCYTEEETQRHMTLRILSLTDLDVQFYYNYYLAKIPEEPRQAYLAEAQVCAQIRASAANGGIGNDASKDEAGTSASSGPMDHK